MALTQSARNKIKSFVQSAKKLLMNEFESQLQQYYGIKPNGDCILVEELTSRDAAVIETARLLRQRLHYLEEGIAGNNKAEQAVRQLIREQAFTILNRFSAIRMAEERNIIRESIRKVYNSEGFLVFDELTGGSKTAEKFTRYTWYIQKVFDELAIDLPAVFNRFSPYGLLFPSEKVLLELLAIINDEELNIYRESGHQPINLWMEDETIGWVYQYYNSREEISEMREASGAPRNSRELAVRNQFFTPRYVVQFLVDNSLGRQWYEMTKGNTSLTDNCQYMVKRPQEIFLNKGEELPEAKIVDAHYIEHRILKDPREILMLDPACGSMHFGLYCFDVFEQIYIEAWDNHPNLLLDLRDKYLREEYIKHIPGYILQYNIHGVDIDPRALQIAGLSLWLRAQKSYDSLNLQPADRPAIRKSNLVLAEPMPGDAQLLSDFTKSLPGPIGKLVRVIWEKMQLVGETGMLLKIEEELKKEIEIAKEEYKQYKGGSTQASLFSGAEDLKVAEMAAIYGNNKKITKDFFDTAEEQVLEALKNFAENAEGEDAFQKLLFAEDTARGFAFIELCRKKYDFIVMNPPFGAASQNSKSYIDTNYSLSKYDLASVFIDRMLILLNQNGNLGSITTRAIFFLGSYTKWRSKELLDNNFIQYFADLGGGVLDAMVETSCYIIKKGCFSNSDSLFFRLTKVNEKKEYLYNLTSGKINEGVFKINSKIFKSISNEPFCYWLDTKTLNIFKNSTRFESGKRIAKKGFTTGNNMRFVKNLWEVTSSGWKPFLIGDYSIRFYFSTYAVIPWKDNSKLLRNNIDVSGKLRSEFRSERYYFKPGLSWSYRTAVFQPHIIPEGQIFTTSRYQAFFGSKDEILVAGSILNTKIFDYWLKLSMEKDYQPKFINGVVNQLPFPKLKEQLQDQLKETIQIQHSKVKDCFKLDDKSVDFISNQFAIGNSISSFANKRKEELVEIKGKYLEDLNRLDELVFGYFDIKAEEIKEIEDIIGKAGNSNEGKVFNQSKSEIIDHIFSILIGCLFGRWDMRILKYWKQEWSDEDIFKARKHSPFLFGPRESTLDLVLPEFHNKIKEIWEMPYPIKPLEECATVSDNNLIVDKLKEVIKYFWPDTFGTIEEELLEHFGVNELSEVFDKQAKFFDAHLKDYSRNKRISPIYWHLGVPSGKFNVWIYYPKLNDNSLYKIVNELVEPKIVEIDKEVTTLEMGNSSKELNDQKEFLHELEDFKEELLRVAQLPFKPNQDDGVLITAAPLHNLFRHTKWRKSTEACWKALQKGEYDWAHLAYSIWPERVAKKCKKDLSMAIAHGLEAICEVKPKVKVERKPKEITPVKQKKLL